jgi:hypothetical protein
MKTAIESNWIYDEITDGRIERLASRLSEKDRRAYAAVEAYKIGNGGVTAISRLLGMSHEKIKKGREELDDPGLLPSDGRQRHSGAGRKGVIEEQPGFEEAFDRIIESHIAGDPMNADVKWTNLQPSGIVAKLFEEGYSATENTVRSLLKKKKFVNGSLPK